MEQAHRRRWRENRFLFDLRRSGDTWRSSKLTLLGIQRMGAGQTGRLPNSRADCGAPLVGLTWRERGIIARKNNYDQ
jgi:hypothetical protein